MVIGEEITKPQGIQLSNQTKEIRQETKDKQLIINSLSFVKIKTIVYDYLTFQDVIFKNTFFKKNKKFNKVKFVNRQADSLTYAFLKSNLADLTGVTITEN